jgi:predicted GNAT family acetyltransferase
VIGASALTTNPDATNHLLTGPCILMEYRNRGLATALLAESLIALREANLTVAHALTKQNSPASQFVYPKFNSTSEPFEREPRLAAS